MKEVISVQVNEKIFSERLLARRKEIGLTQKQVAENLKLDNSTYGKYEKGTRVPSLEILIKIADFYDISIDYLMGKSDKSNSKSLYKEGMLLEQYFKEIGILEDGQAVDDNFLDAIAVIILSQKDYVKFKTEQNKLKTKKKDIKAIPKTNV